MAQTGLMKRYNEIASSYENAILNGDYASNTSGNQVEDSTNTSGNQSYSKSVKGNSGVSATAQKMIQQYRQNIIMINRDIIKDLSTLFIGLY